MIRNSPDNRTILLTFDVEDWFQVENFKEYIPYATWHSRELRVERNTNELLDLLDEAPIAVHATFFVLGWIAERCPSLIREISRRGHEIASHGIHHQLCYNQNQDELHRELIESKKLLEDITGSKVSGYRAPSFSINDQSIDSVYKAGYIYDSSYNSFGGHGRYGSLTLPKSVDQDLPICALRRNFFEIPISNLRLRGKVIPWGGGGYFRLLPTFLHHVGVQYILKRYGCYTFYMHPWEIDPDQPKVKEAKPFFRFRHYVNLSRAKDKLRKFIGGNTNCVFLSCTEFIHTFNEEMLYTAE
jgi:polysaccharide deacetylase family protein (PEP-CTERM system associated)